MIEQATKSDTRTRLETQEWLEARILRDSIEDAKQEMLLDGEEWESLKDSARMVKVVVGGFEAFGKRKFSQVDTNRLFDESDKRRSRSRSERM
jgi:hypothetical protein